MEELIKTIRLFFKNLPDSRTTDYERLIATYSNKCSDHRYIDAMNDIILLNELDAFSAFFCVCTYYRRHKDFELMNEMIEKYKGQFHQHILFNHLMVQYLVHSESFYDYDELLKMAFEDTVKINNVGCLQAFGNAFASICEQCNEADKERMMEKWLSKAIEIIDRAIELDPQYAKFYTTKARIEALIGQFDNADRLIQTAISKEDSSRSDYALTITNYQLYRQSFREQRNNKFLDDRLKRIESVLFKDEELDINVAKTDFLTTYEGTQPYAFISYSRLDTNFIEDFLHPLQNERIRFWFDRGINPGEQWMEVIADHIKKCSLFLLFMTKNSISSINVRRELTYAQSNNKKMIVVVFDDVDLTEGMKMQFSVEQIVKKHSNLTAQQLAKDLLSNLSNEQKKKSEFEFSKYVVEQAYSVSKSGMYSDNEDGYFFNDKYAVIIDGATDKYNLSINGLTGGQIIRDSILDVVQSLTGNESFEETISTIQNHLVAKFPISNFAPMSASAIIVNFIRNEAYVVGDCQLIIDNDYIDNRKAIDSIIAKKRSDIDVNLLSHGSTIEQLMEFDIGREQILPLLKEQKKYENKEVEFGYSVFNNTLNDIQSMISLSKKIPINNKKEIILATDGYPFLSSSLDDCEKNLKFLIEEDPLLIYKFKSTKGLKKGNISFDDRTFIKIRIK